VKHSDSPVSQILTLKFFSPPVGNGVHVVSNPSTLMVRYVFLIPKNGIIPPAANVAPAMLSVYNSLRSGAL